MSHFKDIIEFLPSIHKEGYIFIGIFAIITILFFMLSDFLGVVGIILTIWCVCFFRDPVRVPSLGDVVVSPADGRVEAIVTATAPKELELGNEEFTRVSIFLSVFDVHVNRIPVDGMIRALHYHPGQFVNASFDKASELNERQSILIENEHGQKFPVVQIAGLIARRIVCELDEHQKVAKGDKFGIIRFGSRVDIYLPKGVVPAIQKGQYMIGGETVIAKLSHGKNK